MSTPALKRVIDAANSGRRFPVMDLVRQDPGLAAVVSKMVKPHQAVEYGKDGNRTPNTPNMAEFRTISDHKAQDISDAQTVMQVLPEMELAAQILISSILAPKDMMTTELTYSLPEGLMEPGVSQAMIARVKKHFEQVYKIKTKLHQMLRDMLFETGSYAAAVIPENSIDEAINGPMRVTMESLSDSFTTDGQARFIGLLGPVARARPVAESNTTRLSLESFQNIAPPDAREGKITFEGQFSSIHQRGVEDSYISVTDNFNVLKVPRINHRLREEAITSKFGSATLESISPGARINDRQMSALMYKDRSFTFKPISSLKTQEELARHAVGNPLILHLPSESVIPVFVPGTVEQQVGFFVLLDADGNPVKKPADANHYLEFSNRLNSGGSFPSAMLNKVKGQMSGFNLSSPQHLDYTARIYGNMVEQDLLARLRNGVYGNGVALAKTDEVYRIMLARALAKQHTQLLFIPIELMTYFALRFDERGVGKSMLDDMKIINSLRAMLTFGNVMASLKNSIGRTEVKLKLDEADPDPKKTIEMSIHEFVRSRQQAFPLGMNSPTDLVDYLQRSAYEFTHEGHPGLPDVNIDVSQKADSYVKVDEQLDENLRKRSLMAIGLSPQIVDNGFNADFATSVVAQNLLLAKRVSQIQEQFEPLLNDHLHKAAMNSQELMDDLREILEENIAKIKVDKDDREKVKKDAAHQGAQGNGETEKNLMVMSHLREFITSFEVALPRPNTVTLENQFDALKKYIEALDVALEAYISGDLFTQDFGGTAATYADTVKKIVRAYFIRSWMSENGMLSELSQLTTQDSEGKPMLNFMEMQEAHLDGLTKSIGELVKHAHKQAEKEDKKLEAAGVQAGSGGGGGSSSFGSGGGDSGGGGDDGMGGLSDMSGGDDGLGGGGSPLGDLGGGGGDDAGGDTGGTGADSAAGEPAVPEGGEPGTGDAADKGDQGAEGGDQAEQADAGATPNTDAISKKAQGADEDENKGKDDKGNKA